jgi:formylglycine-generating enzyme required for sulfatase activity
MPRILIGILALLALAALGCKQEKEFDVASLEATERALKLVAELTKAADGGASAAEADPPLAARPAEELASMVAVPPGEFLMGSRAGEGDDHERPQRRVRLDAFMIDKYEVTVDRYGKCVAAGACTPANTDEGCNWGKAARGEHPVNCVDWSQARAYCAWEKKRLPTEAEWEKAARGADGRTYPWGNDKPGTQLLCWEEQEQRLGRSGSTCPVGSRPRGASPCGAHDMAGNVWEWVADWFDEGYYAKSPKANPPGPKAGRARVFRGGGWSFGSTEAPDQRAANRLRLPPGAWTNDLGFRCARSGAK